MKTTIQKNDRKRKRILGLVLGVAALLLYGIFYDFPTGIGLGVVFFAAGWIPLETENKWLSFLFSGLWGIVCLTASCWFPSMILLGGGFLKIGAYRIVMNMLCAGVVYGVCLVLTGRMKPAIVLASGVLLLLAVLNGFIFEFRGNEFKPGDIFAAKTAWNVAGQYTYRISSKLAFVLLGWVWLMFTLYILPKAETPLPKGWFRTGAAVLTALCLGLLLQGYEVITPDNWSCGGTENNGYLLNFVVNFRDSFVRKPEGYNTEEITQLEQRYAETEGSETSPMPNIIVIMSESYADVGVLGDGLRSSEPVTPFLDSLRENTIRGYALCSIFGGVTANSEFEFLTGSSMAFLPEACVPYQQYIQEDLVSLPRILRQAGYETVATHPYFSSGWSRTQVYPRLGFESMTFFEDYPREDFVREYISDREMYAYVLDVLQAEREKPLFLFGITMQNHGDYIYEGANYEKTVTLEGYGEEYPKAEQYLSLLRLTDSATEDFINALEAYSEDTVVLIFGDHFPSVEWEFLEDVHGSPIDTLEEKLLTYSVPFLIWANYDLEEQEVSCTSLNYLSRYLLEAAGIPLLPNVQFLKEMESHVPALNGTAYYSKQHRTFLLVTDAEGEEAWWLRQYELLQYNHLFDRKHHSPLFWKPYLAEVS